MSQGTLFDFVPAAPPKPPTPPRPSTPPPKRKGKVDAYPGRATAHCILDARGGKLEFLCLGCEAREAVDGHRAVYGRREWAKAHRGCGEAKGASDGLFAEAMP